MKRIVVKIGSRVLAKKNGLLNKKVISNLVRDLAEIKKGKNLDILLVTSGAVAVGRNNRRAVTMKISAEAIDYKKRIVHEQVLAAIGQPKLMSLYTREFGKYGIDCAQILATRSDFAKRASYLSLRTVTKNLLNAGVIVIFNENDVLSPEELDFSDNDQLAAMVAAMSDADKLIILTVVDGFLDGPVGDPKTKTIPKIENIKNYIGKIDDSNISRGGMKSKLRMADRVTTLGIEMHIAHGGKKDVVSKILAGAGCGTHFPARSKKQKAVKNWIAAGAAGEGEIRVDAPLAGILRSGKAVSILVAGITGTAGDFKERDVVNIADCKGTRIARGICRYSSGELAKKIKSYKKGGKEKIIAISYDYMVLEK